MSQKEGGGGEERPLDVRITDLENKLEQLTQARPTICVECSCGPCLNCSICYHCWHCWQCTPCICRICNECSCGPCLRA
jgi:hypothetical protein